MRKVPSFLFLFFLCITLQGQELSPEVIVSSGDYLPGSQGSLSFSLGECVTESFTQSIGTVNQGFQQGSFDIISLNRDIKHNITIDVYPNPADNTLNVIMDNAAEDLNVIILDLSGKIIMTKDAVASALQLDISNMPPGEYLLQVTSTAGIIIGSFKIIKH